MQLSKQIAIGLCIAFTAIAATAAAMVATQAIPEKMCRHSSVFVLIIGAAVAVWCYVFQRDVKGKRLSLRALLGLVAALAVGTKIGLSVLANSP